MKKIALFAISFFVFVQGKELEHSKSFEALKIVPLYEAEVFVEKNGIRYQGTVTSCYYPESLYGVIYDVYDGSGERYLNSSVFHLKDIYPVYEQGEDKLCVDVL